MRKIKIKKYFLYDELFELLKNELKNSFDVVIHAAAVSDYQLEKPFKTKVASNLNRLKINLLPTQKIIYSIKKRNPQTFLVGFKLESSMTKLKAMNQTNGLLSKANCDLVVANSLLNNNYHGFIIGRDNQILMERRSRQGLSKALVQTIKEQL